MSDPDLGGKARRVHRLLRDHYGEPQLKERRPPLDELILTILSQNTADVNTARAYARLREHFPTWESVLAADVDAVADAIRVGGLANVKAPRIHAILRELKESTGALDLAFLRDLSVSESRDYLTSLHGVGPKTASCVLLFSLNKPALPVDTHVLRVSRRLGLVPAKASAEKTNTLLEKIVNPENCYSLHLLFIQHGRTLCRASRPRCGECPLAADCDDHARRRESPPE